MWLNLCRQEHKLCETGKFYTPRRVLDLGDLELPLNVRLYEPTPGEELEYLCLSYRWSATPTLQTRKSNINQHKINIPWDALPLAFQHVCSVARRLGLRFVWIDALCLTQDDVAEKALDIAVMDSIFEGAVLTIVSAWADGPEQGLFSDLGDFTHQEFQGTTPDGAVQTVCVRRRLPHFKGGDLPILNRGWIYQELFLSPRLVFFLENEIVWQCQEHTECQCSPYQTVEVWDRTKLRGGFGTRSLRQLNGVRRVFQDRPPLSLLDANAYWWSHIHEYSMCDLTNPSDKLPAIQGLATRMAPELRLGSYIAGMWEKSLIFDLAWYTWDPRPAAPGARRASTLSWASIDGPVRNGSLHLEAWWTPMATVTEIITTPESRGVTNGLRHERITLQCHVREVSIGFRPGWGAFVEDEEGLPLSFDKNLNSMVLWFDKSAPPKGELLHRFLPDDDRLLRHAEFTDLNFKTSMTAPRSTRPLVIPMPEDQKNRTFWCAKILQEDERETDTGRTKVEEIGPGESSARHWQICLVLQRMNNDEYERVGLLPVTKPFYGYNIPPDIRREMASEKWERKEIHLV
ncbi:heterokaryon incompatibility protein-domain-containing protein [Podospora conica]|nr:heterokaryon incompatibility protein-domain-containing protein [Schizothecium conicum]